MQDIRRWIRFITPFFFKFSDISRPYIALSQLTVDQHPTCSFIKSLGPLDIKAFVYAKPRSGIPFSLHNHWTKCIWLQISQSNKAGLKNHKGNLLEKRLKEHKGRKITGHQEPGPKKQEKFRFYVLSLVSSCFSFLLFFANLFYSLLFVDEFFGFLLTWWKT